MSFDLSRLRRGEWVVGAGSVVLLVSMLLLPWYGGSDTVDGWNGLTSFRWLAVVTLVLAGALLFLTATRSAPAVPVTISVVVAIFGAICAVWLIYRVAIDPVAGRKLGGWVALAGAAAIAYGGTSSVRREGISPKDAPAVIPTVDPWAEGRS
jgi:branched-subunit amino acid ABC-type transport system permease component